MSDVNEYMKKSVTDKMLSDESRLKTKYKAYNSKYFYVNISINEVDAYSNKGYTLVRETSKKAQMSKEKDCGTQFEHDIWCMFYNLGFKILNEDEKLKVQWSSNYYDNHQIDVLAIGEDAIFVVECKATKERKKISFKKDIDDMSHYMKGVSNTLKSIYGENKKVKFIFATRNYMLTDDGEDKKRLESNNIYHLDDNAYNYISNLIKSYKHTVVYQFYSLMFKDELISTNDYVIPALRGEMGGQPYYIFSIEPETLLKIGFVLHRTKVNDSMAPTYQRLLVPSRLKGLTKFIDEGGYFPNSVIVNFEAKYENMRIKFEDLGATTSTSTRIGFLHIPNAYGIAYLIDGQHRVYGYANSSKKNKHTIPVVAFEGMPSERQLKIFMEINENQKAVSPSLRLDLEEDLYWDSYFVDSRMKALRSSIIKKLASDSNYELYDKVSIGEDKAKLTFKPFDLALRACGLVPKGKKTQFDCETEFCVYDFTETDSGKAMNKSRDDIARYINGVYSIINDNLNDEKKDCYLFSNRATYPIIVLLGSLNKYFVSKGVLSSNSDINKRIDVIKSSIIDLCKGLNKITEEEDKNLTGALGQGADIFWLRFYQNLVHKENNDFYPEELIIWLETQDKDLQNNGEKLLKEIFSLLKESIWKALKDVYGDDFLDNISLIKNECEALIIKEHKDEEGFKLSNYNWEDKLTVTNLREIIDKNFSNEVFYNRFSIKINQNFKTKKERLQWLSLLIQFNGKKSFTKESISLLENINSQLSTLV